MSSAASSPATIATHHAFMVPLPIQGHVTPMLQLAHHLASNGFCVTLVILDTILSRLLPAQSASNDQSAGSVNLHPNLQILPLSLDKDLSTTVEVSEFQWILTILELMKPSVELIISELVKNKEPPVTCFIADTMLTWAHDVAHAVGLPRIAFAAMSARFHSLLYYLQPLLAPYRSTIMPNLGVIDDSQELITCIPGLAQVVRLRDANFVRAPDTVYEFMRRVCVAMKSANAAIFHSVYEIESSSVDALRQALPIYVIGPLLPIGSNSLSLKPRPFDEDEECLQWLDSQDPSSVLYISFGTTGLWSEAELKELALGLEASQQPFLWVIRPTLQAEKPTFSISEIFPDQTKHRRRIVSWAPQLSVLQHPSVGGILTHCGWNSTLESIYMGVPMIGWPKVADQMVNARIISQVWKIGIILETQNYSTIVRSVTIQEAVRTLFTGDEGEEARRRISELKKVVRTAARDSKNNLVDFLKDVTKTVSTDFL